MKEGEPVGNPAERLAVAETSPDTGSARLRSSAIVGADVRSASDPELAADAVEAALAAALQAATVAGKWDVVAQLARELEARRTARGGVVDLAVERKRRGGA